MKFTLICLSIFVAAASPAPQDPSIIGSPFRLPVQRVAQIKMGRLIPPAGGFVYRGPQQDNIRPKEVMKPVAPVKPITPKPSELSSCIPTIAEKSRCSQDYRKKEGLIIAMVVKGDIASENEFPFLVALVLNNDNQLSCGGSLISPTKILTAAHCVTTDLKSTEVADVDRFHVKLGMNFINDTFNDAQLTRNITKIEIHEDYEVKKSNVLKNDIAILTMDKPVEYTKTISPVCLVPDCLKDDNELQVTAMGWGTTQLEGETSDYLRFADGITTVPNDKCRETYKDLVDNQMLCAYNDEGKGPCQGDSGGPLVIKTSYEEPDFKNSCRFMQVGIVSWGAGCAKKGSPGVYTRVKNYLPWICKHSK